METAAELQKKWIKMWLVKTGNDGDITTISTWSSSLDYALGWWLWEGKIIEVLGNSGSWKSSLCLHFAKQAQWLKKKVMYVDMENALNKQRVEDTWVNYDDMLIVVPENGNEAIDMMQAAMESKWFGMIIWDGIDSSISKKILNSDNGESHMWVNARMISEAMRKFNASLRGRDTTFVMTNQYRVDLWATYGDWLTTPWWSAPRFYSSQTIKLSKLAKAECQIVDSQKNKIWTYVKCKIEKNRIWEPDRIAEFNLMFDGSIKEGKFIIPKFVETGILTREGNTFFKDWEKIGTHAKLVEYYASDLDMYYSDCAAFVEWGMAKNKKKVVRDNNPF